MVELSNERNEDSKCHKIDCKQDFKQKLGIWSSCEHVMSNVKVITSCYAIIGNYKKLRTVHDKASDGTWSDVDLEYEDYEMENCDWNKFQKQE